MGVSSIQLATKKGEAIVEVKEESVEDGYSWD
jgi:hypothetical protein